MSQNSSKPRKPTGSPDKPAEESVVRVNCVKSVTDYAIECKEWEHSSCANIKTNELVFST